MKNFIITLLVMAHFTAYSQSYDLIVKNRQVIDNTYTFDIFLLRTSLSEFYLGDAQFSFNMNLDAFLHPEVEFSGFSNAYSGNAFLSINQLTAELKVFSQPEYLQEISSTGDGTYIGTISIKGLVASPEVISHSWNTGDINGTYVRKYHFNLGKQLQVTGQSFIISSPTAIISDFNAVYQNNSISIGWISLYENQLSYYEVQKSKDNSEWQSLSKLEGTDNKTFKYIITDEDISDGKYYYRLKMKNIFGEHSYSQITSLEVTKTGQLMVYPTLALPNQTITIDYINFPLSSFPATMYIVNTQGKVIVQENVTRVNSNSVQTGNLPAGIYHVVAVTENKRYHAKFIVK